jgi:hypothetical protein
MLEAALVKQWPDEIAVIRDIDPGYTKAAIAIEKQMITVDMD